MAKTKTIENLFFYSDFFAYCDTFSNLLPIILFLLYKRADRKFAGVGLIIFYLGASFLINCLLKLTSNENSVLYEALTLIEYCVFVAFIRLQTNHLKAKKMLLYSSIAFILFFLVFNVYLQRSAIIDSVPIGIETIIVLGFGFYYLYEQTNDTTTLFIYNKPAFWIIFGMIIYLAGSFFIYIFANYTTREILTRYWFVTNIFSIIKNIFFCVAIYNNAKPNKENLKYSLELSQLN